jgi:hypothetical protein
MRTFAVYDATTGRLFSLGSVLPEKLPDGLVAVEAPADRSKLDWDPETRDWVPRPPTLKTRYSKLEFRSRFTLEEQVALDLASIGATVPAATLRVILASWAAADFINLDDPRVAQGIGLIAQSGLLTPARAAEILTPDVVGE